MVKLNKIYTRTGDDGMTGLVDGSRLAKHSTRIEATGVIDETNSAIGIAVASLNQREYADILLRIQNDLFDLGADLATPGDDFTHSQQLRMQPTQTDWLEQEIDRLNETLSPLTSFILPGGSEAAARVHVARATARRAERIMTMLASEVPVNPAALTYINRLSDFLFVLARALNDYGATDVLWVPGANR